MDIVQRRSDRPMPTFGHDGRSQVARIVAASVARSPFNRPHDHLLRPNSERLRWKPCLRAVDSDMLGMFSVADLREIGSLVLPKKAPVRCRGFLLLGLIVFYVRPFDAEDQDLVRILDTELSSVSGSFRAIAYKVVVI